MCCGFAAHCHGKLDLSPSCRSWDSWLPSWTATAGPVNWRDRCGRFLRAIEEFQSQLGVSEDQKRFTSRTQENIAARSPRAALQDVQDLFLDEGWTFMNFVNVLHPLKITPEHSWTVLAVHCASLFQVQRLHLIAGVPGLLCARLPRWLRGGKKALALKHGAVCIVSTHPLLIFLVCWCMLGTLELACGSSNRTCYSVILGFYTFARQRVQRVACRMMTFCGQ
jgi:hypothetical protein